MQDTDRGIVLRRMAHSLIALAPLYYLLPVEMPVSPIRRWHLLIAFFIIIMILEAVRLRRGITFLGLRPHEAHSIASFVWAAAGITFALWLMPMDIAVPVLIGMGLVDPLVGELRRTGARPAASISAPLLVYALICVATLLMMTEKDLVTILAVSCFGAFLAVGAERLDLPVIDDDFLMIVVPGSLMSFMWLYAL
ncbi:MAG: hypothetical protein OEM29_02865 [Thermoplasmata archaeon]|nr:hypothetical protein [Thermoplasmata archaeon]